MDLYSHSSFPSPATEQNRLASPRNPGSLARSWLNNLKTARLTQAGKSTAGQLGARFARLSKMENQPQLQGMNMFPFRIFLQPTKLAGVPGWSDSFGPAAWRTFQVWTGQAIAYCLQEGATDIPDGAQLAIPQLVYVARTSGYNLSGTGNTVPNISNIAGLDSNNNTAIQQLSFINENYNEFYSAAVLGAYPANPNNDTFTSPLAFQYNGLGPANYANPYNECVFTANPNSIAVFWISWDTNNQTTVGDNTVNMYQIPLSNNFAYAAFPVLHFGGYDVNGNWYGDLNSTIGPYILGQLAQECPGIPTQLYPYFPADAVDAFEASGSYTPEGSVLVGAIQVGAQGFNQNTGNDGLIQIFQCLFDNLSRPMRRNKVRYYSPEAWFFPGEIIWGADADDNAPLGNMFINATDFALQGFDPLVLGADPVNDGPTFYDGDDTDNSWTNLWMPISPGTQVAEILDEEDDYLICNLITDVDFTNVTTNAADGTYNVNGLEGTLIFVNKPFMLMRSTYDGQNIPPPYGLNYQALSNTNNASYLATYVSSNQRTLGDYRQAIMPPYYPGALIDVSAVPGGTGLIVDDEYVVIYQDLNTDARQWATETPSFKNVAQISFAVGTGIMSANSTNLGVGFRLETAGQFYTNSIA